MGASQESHLRCVLNPSFLSSCLVSLGYLHCCQKVLFSRCEIECDDDFGTLSETGCESAEIVCG